MLHKAISTILNISHKGLASTTDAGGVFPRLEKRRRFCATILILLLFCLAGCEAMETQRQSLPLEVGQINSSFTTESNYEIKLTKVEIFAKDFQFAVAGEAHASAADVGGGGSINRKNSWFAQIYHIMIPQAYAHPGHFSNGDVTGQLLGDYPIVWPAQEGGKKVGMADLLNGKYTSANISLQPQKKLTIEGKAKKNGGKEISFSFAFTTEKKGGEIREILGIPIVGKTTVANADNTNEVAKSIAFEFVPNQTSHTPSLFQGIDFERLVTALNKNDIEIHSAPADNADKMIKEPYYLLEQRLFTHDFYQFTFK